MRNLRIQVTGLFFLLMTLAPLCPPDAAASSFTVNVHATVLPWLQFSARQNVHTFEVTEDDIRNGYIDLPGSVSIEYRSNMQGEIDLEVLSGGAEWIGIREKGRGLFSETYRLETLQGGAPVFRTLDVRVILNKETRTGAHPLQLSLAPHMI